MNELNIQLVRKTMEQGFNQGDLSVIDELVAPDGIDHQEPPGTAFIPHLKQVITGLRTAFPDLHFEIHEILADGDIVAFRSTMTGTHTGMFRMGIGPTLPATGRQVVVPHMHFVRLKNGKATDLWHQWNIPMLLQQLGVGMVANQQAQ